MKKLSEQERIFVDSIGWGLSDYAAGVAAGFPPKTAAKEARRLMRLPRILTALSDDLELMLKVDPSDYAVNDDWSPKPEAEIPPKIRRLVKITRSKDGKGWEVQYKTPVHILNRLRKDS